VIQYDTETFQLVGRFDVDTGNIDSINCGLGSMLPYWADADNIRLVWIKRQSVLSKPLVQRLEASL